MLETALMWYMSIVVLSWMYICKEVREACRGQISLSWDELFVMVVGSFIPLVNWFFVIDLFTPVLHQLENLLKGQVFKGKRNE